MVKKETMGCVYVCGFSGSVYFWERLSDCVGCPVGLDAKDAAERDGGTRLWM